MSAPPIVVEWIADRAHSGCGGDRVRGLVEGLPEKGQRPRRGVKRKIKLAAVYAAICTKCGEVRIFAYPPREQRALALEVPPAPPDAKPTPAPKREEQLVDPRLLEEHAA